MAEISKKQFTKMPTAFIAFGVILIALMTIIGMSAFLRANEIKVEGASVNSVADIVEASGLSVGDNLLFLNAQNVSLKIREALPFVSAVQVSRILPDTILIEINESAAIASTTFGGEIHVLDSAGRVLARSNGGILSLPGIEADDLIEIRGLEIEDAVVGSILKSEFGAETKLQNMQDVLAALERERLNEDVSYLDVSSISNIHFGYLRIYRVVIGERRYLRQKLERLTTAVSEIEHRHPRTPGDIIMTNVTDASAEVGFRPTH